MRKCCKDEVTGKDQNYIHKEIHRTFLSEIFTTKFRYYFPPEPNLSTRR